MASLKEKNLFRDIYLEALPKTPAPGAAAPKQPVPQKTEDADKIKQQAQPIINALNKSAAEDPEPDLDDFGHHYDSIETFEDTDKPVFNYRSLKVYVNDSYENKQPLMVYGVPGIGKSKIIREECQVLADSMNRKYIYWNHQPVKVKLDALQHPEKYFINLDIRADTLSPEDFAGIPDIASKLPYLETKQFVWIYMMSLENSAGMLFLDELNHATHEMMHKMYEIVLDKSAGGTPFAPDWGVIGAGNLDERVLPEGLVARFTSGVLVANPEMWLEWAEANNLDKRIIAFVRSAPADNFYGKPKTPGDPFPNPRSMEELSRAMKNTYKKYAEAARKGKTMPISIYKAIGDKASGLLGGSWARKFFTFLKMTQSFDIRNMSKDPSKISKYDADKLNALTVFLTGKIRQASSNMLKTPNYMTQANPNDVEIIEGAAKITEALSSEYQAVLWSMIRRDIPKENFEVVMSFLYKGQYDPKTKDQWNKNTFPKLVEFLEYEDR